jgi:non-ribosomal peptide synthetase component F
MSGQAPYARDGGHDRSEISGGPDDLALAGPASPAAGTPSFAGRAVDYGGFRPVPALIEEQADRHPGRVAACYAGRALTYRQLDQFANGLAAAAAARGVGRGDRVAVLLVNSLEMPVAYLALMKLGAVFVPMDPAWPDERLRTTLRVLAPRLVLCAAAGLVPGEFRGAALAVSVDGITPSPRRPAVALRPADLIYGFFTSGTTGTPKCAMNRHTGLARLAALLPVPSGQDEAALRQALRGLLTDNPALFRKDECRRLERRWRLADGRLHGPITAYRSYPGRP